MTTKEMVKTLDNMPENSKRVIDVYKAVEELSSRLFNRIVGGTSNSEEIVTNFTSFVSKFRNLRNERTGEDYYYGYDEIELNFWFVTKRYFDLEKCVDDQPDKTLSDILPEDFFEVQESCFDYHGDSTKAIQWLNDNGFVRNEELEELVCE